MTDKTERKILYLYSCGCTVERENAIKKTNVYSCPKHPKAKIIERYSFCIDCGCVVKNITGSGEVPLRCTEHAKVWARKRGSAVRKNNKNNTGWETSTKSPDRKPNCRWYFTHCLQIGGKLFKSHNACKNCKDYKYKEKNGIEIPETSDRSDSVYFGC